jgi:peptidoglycan/xylan/chitin deacetylase (PgdA/CDA1 family)
MTRDEVIRIAREAGYGWSMTDMHAPALARFAALVAEAEADKHNTGSHTCSDRCQRYACVAVREAVAAERKKYAVLIDAVPTWVDRAEQHPDHNGIVTHDMINARMQEEIDALREMIRERGEA